MSGNPDKPMESQAKLSLRTLFTGFFQAGILGFGGVLPIARRMIVEQRRWLTQGEFNDLFSLCQFLPGANIVNLAFVLGARNRGTAGAAAAIAGLLLAPFSIVLLLSLLYDRYGAIPTVQHTLGGLAAAAAGLVMGTAVKMAVPVLRGPRQIVISVLVFAMVIFGHVALPLTMLLALPLSIALHWRA